MPFVNKVIWITLILRGEVCNGAGSIAYFYHNNLRLQFSCSTVFSSNNIAGTLISNLTLLGSRCIHCSFLYIAFARGLSVMSQFVVLVFCVARSLHAECRSRSEPFPVW